ncbi:MAG: thermonuclease family protein [Clostridia bacterium]|nr:thermonuclease family protein [Clostridia bacterium]
MYYENKRTFYLKQYGPVALILVVALILIGSGIYIALKPEGNGLSANNNPIDVNSYKLSEEAYTAKVIEVNDLCIKVEADSTVNEVYLIGIKANKNRTILSNQIAKDLIGKTVTVDFDNVKVENGKVYSYIYVDQSLYNETLLAKGYAELRTERQNINKLDILLAAQLDAKHEGLGIWSY